MFLTPHSSLLENDQAEPDGSSGRTKRAFRPSLMLFPQEGKFRTFGLSDFGRFADFESTELQSI